MRSLKTSLFVLGISGLAGFAAVVGCSASGDSEVTDPAPTDPGSSGAVLPEAGSSSGSSGSSGGTDGGKKDGGPKVDSGFDAGPPPPTPHTPCPTLNQIKTKSCGKCGVASTVCLAGDGGAGEWTDYSACESETGECEPGATGTEACGNCGTLNKTCSNFCSWTVTACGGEPVDSCTPGAVDLVTAGCSTPDTYRQRSCQAACTWTNFTTACEAAPTFLLVPPTVGSTNSTIVSLKSTQTNGRLSGTCPTGTINSTITPYNYFEVRNPTAKTAVVNIYHSQAPGGAVIDTVIAAYAGATPPADAARATCVKGVNDYGTTALVGDPDFASLDGASAVSIPPGGSVTVYSAAYYTFNATDPGATTGKMKLSVQVVSLN